jgi:DNA invertase Pin-like site-specific DNA recombinase
MRYALYARKSSEDSSKQVQSIENQIQVLKEKAEKEGLKIVKIYQESKSAKQPYKREQFIKMIKDLQDGVIEGIITWKLDRLSRNPIDGGTVQHFLLEGIIKEIVTYEKTYYPNDNSIMMSVELGMATR